MTDRELLELAAKAAQLPTFNDLTGATDGLLIGQPDGGMSPWNPLANDGDALRLAVRLCVQVDPLPLETFVGWTFVEGRHQRGKEHREFHDGDEMAATRRAIVRAAAEIGRSV